MKNHLALQMSLLAAAGAALPLLNGQIVNVVERNGDTDRPSAKYTGQTFDIENPTGTVLVSGYTVPYFGTDAKTMTDRTHDYGGASTAPLVGLPSYLVGGEYIMIANNNRDNATYALDITLGAPSTIYLLIDNRLGDGDAATPPSLGAAGLKMQWVDPANGWNPVLLNGNHVGNAAFPDEVGIDEGADGTINNWSSVYAKTVPAGTTTLAEFNEAGRNMYGVVVIPEPGTLTLLGLGLGGLFLARQRRA